MRGRRGGAAPRQVFVIVRSLNDFITMIHLVKSCEKWNFPVKAVFFYVINGVISALIYVLTFHPSPSSRAAAATDLPLDSHAGDNSGLCVTRGLDRQAQLWQSGARAPRPPSPRQTRPKNPEQFSLCGSTGNHQQHPNDRKL